MANPLSGRSPRGSDVPWRIALASLVLAVASASVPSAQPPSEAAPGAAACMIAASGTGFHNAPFEMQTGTFTAEVDATPSVSPTNSIVGLSLGAPAAHAGFAILARLNADGNIDARNGGAYAAAAVIRYSAGVTYHFRLMVDIPQHRYSVFVTPQGGSEQAVGINFSFRTEQNGVGSLNSWGVWTNTTPSGETSACNFSIGGGPPPPDCVTALAGAGYQNRPFATRSGAFSAEFDATPSAAPMDATISISNGPQTAHTGFATLVRFSTARRIDARNGGAYASASAITYAAGVSHHFRLLVDVPSRSYSIFVTPQGGTERIVGRDFAFRSEQSGVTSLNSWGVRVNSGSGQATVCNFRVVGGGSTPDFSLAATPSSQAVTAGGTASYAVAVSPSNSFAANVSLAASGLPAGATASFSPPTVAGGSGSSTFRVTTSASTPAGTSTLTITGSGGGLTHATTVLLTVTGGDAAPTAAELLAKLNGCQQVSNGLFRTDSETAATIPICQLNGAVFWKADMDIDCDGVRTTQCSERTDPAFQPDTSAHTSTGAPFNAATMPYMVIPSVSSRFNFGNFNIQLGAVVAVIFNNKVEYAVFADTGPVQIIGEASYATAQRLGINPDPANGGVDSGVTYIVFQGSHVSPIESHAAAVALGQQLARQFINRN